MNELYFEKEKNIYLLWNGQRNYLCFSFLKLKKFNEIEHTSIYVF